MERSPPQLVAATRSRRALALASRDAVLLPLAATYAVLLAASWTPDTLATLMPGSLRAGLAGRFAPQFFPRLAGVAALFARPPTSASLWVHLLAVNVFAARGELLASRHVGGWAKPGDPPPPPAAVTAVLIILIATTGPAGLAAAAAVRGARWWAARARRAA